MAGNAARRDGPDVLDAGIPLSWTETWLIQMFVYILIYLFIRRFHLRQSGGHTVSPRLNQGSICA